MNKNSIQEKNKIPEVILGGDPFSNQFRYLYRKDRWWKLHDPQYCLSVMQSAYDAGCRGFDLSFQENVNLFLQLKRQVKEPIIGFANPTWEQGVMYQNRYLFFIRDRILRSLIEGIWPSSIAEHVKNKLSQEDVLVFGYDTEAALLDEKDIASIYLDEALFKMRLSIFKNICQYACFGGSDADYLVSLGRMDLIQDMLGIVESEGFIPLLLCQYPSLVIPEIEGAGINIRGYVVPLNRVWSWFDHESSLKALKSTNKSVIAFMALSHSDLRKDIHGSLSWLYKEAGVESILFGTATPEHAKETTEIVYSLMNQMNLAEEPG